MKYIICLFACLFCSFSLSAETSEQRMTRAEIKVRIQELQQQKITLEERARWADREADRLLFLDYYGSRVMSMQAARYRERIKQIDKEISDLKRS